MKKIVFFALTLAMAFALTGCSRNVAPSVTPSPSGEVTDRDTGERDDGVPSDDSMTDDDTAADDGLLGDIGSGIGDVADGVGDAVDDAARGIGDAARDVTR